MDHARMLKVSNYVHLPSLNKIIVSISLRLSAFTLYSVREVIIFEHGRYISALKHSRMLILSSYVLLGCINTIYKYGHTWLI